MTRTLQGNLTELRTLLTATLDEDPYLPWDRFKVPMLVAELKPPQEFATELPPPQASDFMPEPLTGLGALAPGRKRAHAEAVAQGEAAYEQALAAHAQAERHRKEQLARAQSDHEQSVSRERERVRRQHAVVDQMARDFAEGKRKAVADYFSGVLAVQRYPSDFPTGVKVAYLPPDRELRIDIDLPLMHGDPRSRIGGVPDHEEGTQVQEAHPGGPEQALPAGRRPDGTADAPVRLRRGPGRSRPRSRLQRLCRHHRHRNGPGCALVPGQRAGSAC